MERNNKLRSKIGKYGRTHCALEGYTARVRFMSRADVSRDIDESATVRIARIVEDRRYRRRVSYEMNTC